MEMAYGIVIKKKSYKNEYEINKNCKINLLIFVKKLDAKKNVNELRNRRNTRERPHNRRTTPCAQGLMVL